MKKIPKNATALPEVSKRLTAIESKFLGVEDNGKNSPYISLKYYQPTYQCFSVWNQEQLKQFSAFVEKMRKTEWPAIYKTGGSVGNKTGLGYTVHKNKGILPDRSILDKISPEITFFELRVTQEARVHGFRVQSAFFLVWLDKDHEIYPS